MKKPPEVGEWFPCLRRGGRRLKPCPGAEGGMKPLIPHGFLILGQLLDALPYSPGYKKEVLLPPGGGGMKHFLLFIFYIYCGGICRQQPKKFPKGRVVRVIFRVIFFSKPLLCLVITYQNGQDSIL